jgi:branched-chain amino acid transport system substrate-binding protein
MANIAFRSVVAALALATGAFASSGLAQGLRLGVVTSMTGGLQEFGPTTLNGINVAVEEVNAAGGVLGGKMQIVVGDDQTTPHVGVATARKLIEVDRVSGIIGSLSSGVTIPIAQSVTSAAGVPQISTASTSPVITTLQDNDFLFRTVPTDAVQGVALAQVVKGKNVNDVAIVYVNNDYGKGLAESFSAAYKKLGGKVTQSVPYEEKQASFRGELQRAAQGKSSHLLLIAYPQDGIPILRQSLEGGLFKRFIFTDGMKSTDMLSAIGPKFLEGAFGTAPEAAGDGQARFRQAYEKRFGALPPKPFIDSAYDAAMIFALAATKARSSEPRRIRDAIRQVANAPGERILPGEFAKAKKLLEAGKDVHYIGAAGPQDFDKHGDVAGTYAHWEVESGKLVTRRVFVPD